MEAVVFSVHEFNEYVNVTLSQTIGEVTIRGEVSGYQIRQNKWLSFDLKDEASVLNCFGTVFNIDLPLADGQSVLVTGTPRLYIPYGKFSLTIHHVAIEGEGAIKKAFDELKNKLETEGLFVPEHKRPIPRFPESIGIITSGEGAAVNDIRKVIDNRWGGLKLFLAPVLVQGKDAPDQLIGALNYFNAHHPVDVIIFGRGGGSLEDLQAFNSERVARAIFASRIPVISGIGHEHNTSIADLVADIRAATPSNAAEIAVPDKREVRRQIESAHHQASHILERRISESHQTLNQLRHHLIYYLSNRLSEIRSLIINIRRLGALLANRLTTERREVTRLRVRCRDLAAATFSRTRETISKTSKLLAALNPQSILKRGYSITYDVLTDKPLIILANLPAHGKIKTQLSDGTFESTVKQDHQQGQLFS